MIDEHRILIRQRGVTERTLAAFEHSIAGHPVTPPADVHPILHDAARRGMESLRDEMRARIVELDAEIEAVLALALWQGMGIETHPVWLSDGRH